MEILFISDYVCPYCIVAKEALRIALERSDIRANITWQPFELTPEPRPRVDTYHDPVRREHYQVLIPPAKQMGIDMKLPPNIVPRPYTRLAFEGWFYACDHGCGDRYNDAVYHAYFVEEQDIGDCAVLTALAGSLGMDADDFGTALAQGRYTAAEQEAVRYAREVLKPRGVPTIYMNGIQVNVSEYTPEEMLRLLIDARAASGPSFFCGPDGC